jgi:hypothetical protein
MLDFRLRTEICLKYRNINKFDIVHSVHLSYNLLYSPKNVHNKV